MDKIATILELFLVRKCVSNHIAIINGTDVGLLSAFNEVVPLSIFKYSVVVCLIFSSVPCLLHIPKIATIAKNVKKESQGPPF